MPTRAVTKVPSRRRWASPRVQVSEMQRARPLSAAVVTVEELGWSGASVAHITARTRISTHVLRPVREPRRLPAGSARRGSRAGRARACRSTPLRAVVARARPCRPMDDSLFPRPRARARTRMYRAGAPRWPAGARVARTGPSRPSRRAPPIPAAVASTSGAENVRIEQDPLREVPMRLTYRTARVLETIAERPGVSNRVVGELAGVPD